MRSRLLTALLIPTLLLITSPSSAFAQSAGASADAALAKQVVDAENAWAAAFQACKPDALNALTTEDFTYTDFNGMTYSRVWFMKTAKDCTHNVVRIEPMQISINDGDKAAIVLSRYHQFVNDKPVAVYHLTHILVRDNGTWKLAHHHSTVMQSQAGPAGDQYGLPNSGKAFTQLVGGPSTRTAPPFSPQIARFVSKVSPSPAASRVEVEKLVMDAAYTYANTFQNCRTGAFEKVVGHDYFITGFNGMTYTRIWMLKGTDDCYHSLQRIEPLQLRLYGDGTAILLARYHQIVSDRAADLRHLTLTLFREDGVWKVAHHHSTTFNENVGSAEGKLFYSEGGDSTLNGIPMPNKVLKR